jgi:predicted AAA+ superfamily ATPase
MKILNRDIDSREARKRIHNFPVAAILGPRQCGKTTLAGSLEADHYFDLENPWDADRLKEHQPVLEDLHGLIVIDEIQRIPHLFPLIRYLVDTHPNQKYLTLGSASWDLIRQSSESMAGRIAYYQLAGFRLDDVGPSAFKRVYLQGGGLPLVSIRIRSESSLA